MPRDTNGVYQQVSSPKPKNCGVGTGVSYPVSRPEGMGGNQYKPASPGQGKPSMDGKGNSTYSK